MAIIKVSRWTLLVFQGLQFRLPMQGTQVWPLVWGESTGRQTTEPAGARACAAQQEEARRWDARSPQPRTASAPTAGANKDGPVQQNF